MSEVMGNNEQLLFQFYHQFIRYVEILRSFGVGTTLDRLNYQIPKEIKKKTGIEQVHSLADYVYANMKFDKSLALPRCNDPIRIWEHKRGRCGEFAILYTAMVQSLGWEARLIFDASDHVWTEVRVVNEWVPVDCTMLNPMIGWLDREKSEKELSYILAFGPSHVEDVTQDYTAKWDEVLKRRGTLTPFVEYLIETFNLGADREDWE